PLFRSSERAENERPELSEPRRGEGKSDNSDHGERLEREQNKFFIQSQRGDTDCTCNHREQRKTARCCKGHHESSHGSKAVEQSEGACQAAYAHFQKSFAITSIKTKN